MIRKYFFWAFIFAIAISLWLNCATTRTARRSPAQYKAELATYIKRIKSNPGDAEAYREIGVIAYELKKYPLARKFLTKAYKFNSRDGKTLYFLGLTLEAQNQLKLALQVYQKHRSIPKLSSYRSLMAGRYELVNRKLIRQEMTQLLAQENQLSKSRISPVAIAIFPFSYSGSDKKYASLGKGIAEMMITDLSQVKGLHPIERVHLQTLMDEIGLGQTGLIREDSAPRFGKLLGAGKIVAGSFRIEKKKRVTFDAAFWDVLKNKFPPPTSKTDKIDKIFYLEKDLVFQLIDEMGILLTPEEKLKIQQIPTKNLQAFLAYCQGLEMEDAGDFARAAQFFQKAVRLDPNFGSAKQKQAKTNMMLAATKSFSPAGAPKPSLVVSHEPKIELSKTDLVHSRLNNISTNIGTIFIPGQDSRKPTEEAAEVGADIFIGLPLPPDPPSRQAINP